MNPLQHRGWLDPFKAVLSEPAFKFAVSAYLVARVALTAWSLLIFLLVPVTIQNLTLYGQPVVAVFDQRTGERFVYSSRVEDAVLTFRADRASYISDTQTGSVWSLHEGRAVSGAYSGRALSASTYTVEDIFPYLGVPAVTRPVFAVWQRFDANWYLAIAERGYAADGSTVYFPLFPFLIRAVSAPVGDLLPAALLISNLALVGALYLVIRLSEEMRDSATSRRAAVYLLLFPTAFFLLAAYTESLFLFFTLGAFRFATLRRWYLAALFGVFAALTRLQGVMLMVPLAYMLWREFGALGRNDPSRIRHYAVRGITLLFIPLSTLAFLAFTNLSLLANYVGQLHAQFVLPWENVAASVARLSSGQASLIDALNLLMTIIFGALLIAVWRKLPCEYGLFALLMFFAPLFRMTASQPLVSMMRYGLALFPVFVLLGAWGKHAWVNRLVVYTSVPLQLFLSAQFVMWGWVG